ncbi:MAG: amidohydrolase [Clostridia bacterium]|nr:amidohydrolase [Clostridia bacterium]
MLTPELILQEAKNLSDYMIEIRRDIHAHPELGREEYRTQALVIRELEAMGIEAQPIADTGVLGLLRGAKPGKTIGLRADMDALPIQEDTGLPFASQNAGVMHACGHDAHTASLLGTAKLLAAHKDELSGNVKFFFQPNEEGDGGAQRMVDAGCLENPTVDAVFGGHNSTEKLPGQYGLKFDKCYAASNTFTVTVHGKGCHGAYPGSGLDPIVVASQIVVALQTLTSRRLYATDSAIVTVGSFHAGTAGNIIPETVELKGTIRTLGPEMRENMCRWFTELVEGTAKAMGARAEVDLRESHPGVVNEDAFSNLVYDSMIKLVGKENIRLARIPNMGTEDFGAFMKRDLSVPGCFCSFGFGGENCDNPAHSPFHRINEEGMAYAAALFAQVSLDFLREE